MARGLNGSANGSGRWTGGSQGVEARAPGGSSLPPEVAHVLSSVVGLHTTIPKNRRSAQTLGSEREGHGIVIDEEGLILTIGYLMVEAHAAEVITNEGRTLAATIVGYDPETGTCSSTASCVTGSGLINATDAFGYPTLRRFTFAISTRF